MLKKLFSMLSVMVVLLVSGFSTQSAKADAYSEKYTASYLPWLKTGPANQYSGTLYVTYHADVVRLNVEYTPNDFKILKCEDRDLESLTFNGVDADVALPQYVPDGALSYGEYNTMICDIVVNHHSPDYRGNQSFQIRLNDSAPFTLTEGVIGQPYGVYTELSHTVADLNGNGRTDAGDSITWTTTYTVNGFFITRIAGAMARSVSEHALNQEGEIETKPNATVCTGLEGPRTYPVDTTTYNHGTVEPNEFDLSYYGSEQKRAGEQIICTTTEIIQPKICKIDNKSIGYAREALIESYTAPPADDEPIVDQPEINIDDQFYDVVRPAFGPDDGSLRALPSHHSVPFTEAFDSVVIDCEGESQPPKPTEPEPTVPEPTVPEPTVPEPTVPEPTVPASTPSAPLPVETQQPVLTDDPVVVESTTPPLVGVDDQRNTQPGNQLSNEPQVIVANSGGTLSDTGVSHSAVQLLFAGCCLIAIGTTLLCSAKIK